LICLLSRAYGHRSSTSQEKTMRTSLLLATAVAIALPVSSAMAGTQLRIPSGNAACPAQAFVPSNTDPTQPALGPILSAYFRFEAAPGDFSQRGQECKSG
jgi:hypothetical protein